jgi:hypothetical protein
MTVGAAEHDMRGFMHRFYALMTLQTAETLRVRLRLRLIYPIAPWSRNSVRHRPGARHRGRRSKSLLWLLRDCKMCHLVEEQRAKKTRSLHSVSKGQGDEAAVEKIIYFARRGIMVAGHRTRIGAVNIFISLAGHEKTYPSSDNNIIGK